MALGRWPGARSLRRLAAALALLAAGPALAQELQAQEPWEQPGAARTLWLFQVLCFDHIPDIGAIAVIAAEEGFEALEGPELRDYEPEAPAEELLAWRFEDFGELLVLSASRARPDADFRAQVPAFADSTAYACSLSNPTPSRELLPAMTAMMGRPPDEAWEQPPAKVHSWSGESEELLILVYFYGALSGGPGGLLSATAFVRN